MERTHAVIALNAINHDDFLVSERQIDGEMFYLINPRKSKHVWAEDELHLRSLLVRENGEVVSAGWPKFGNFGENQEHDEAFLDALADKQVFFTDKLDGTLIILSFINGKPHFRTRGSHTLGTFEAPVMALIQEKYPKLLEWYTGKTFLPDILRDEFSLLFEYTGPDNRIVLKYPEARLTFLGAMDLTNLTPSVAYLNLQVISTLSGVPHVEAIQLDGTTMQDIGPIVRSWQDREGVVARFKDGGKRRMLKIKATQYIRLHALKFKLEGKVHKLACLLGIRSIHDVVPRLTQVGIDFEARQFLMPEMYAYLARLGPVEEQWGQFKKIVTLTAEQPLAESVEEGHTRVLTGVQTEDKKAHRKWFVESVKQYIASNGFPEPFFGAAMKLYEGKEADADLAVFANLVMEESVSAVKGWLANPLLTFEEMLDAPMEEND